MHWRQMMESLYVGAWDLMDEDGNSRDLDVEIDRVEKGEVVSQSGKARKPVVYFKGKTKPMVFNVTNCTAVSKLYGNDPRQWAGKRITLYVGEANNKGETVPALRVRPRVPGGANRGKTNGGPPNTPPPTRDPGMEG